MEKLTFHLKRRSVSRVRTCAWEKKGKKAMAKSLQTKFGKIKKLGWNPRNISDVAFTNLCDSIRRDPEFMVARPIIVDENNDILGGNQRYTALQTIYAELNEEGLEEGEAACWGELMKGRLPDEWVKRVEGWSIEKKKRFNLIDNSPAGIAGDFDYEKIKAEFGLDIAADSGIDMSNLMDAEGITEFEKSAKETAEQSDMGEDSERLQIFRDAREEMKANGKDSYDVSFHVDFVFQSTEQKEDFLKKAGLETKYGLFGNGLELAKKMGIELIASNEKVFTPRRVEKRLDELAMDVEKVGGVPPQTDETEEGDEGGEADEAE